MPLALHLCERTEPAGVSTADEWGREDASAHLQSAREGSKMSSSMGMLAAIVAGASSDLDGSLAVRAPVARKRTHTEVSREVRDIRSRSQQQNRKVFECYAKMALVRARTTEPKWLKNIASVRAWASTRAAYREPENSTTKFSLRSPCGGARGRPVATVKQRRLHDYALRKRAARRLVGVAGLRCGRSRDP